MKNKILILSALMLAPAIPVFALTAGVVPCVGAPCTPCDLWVMADTIMFVLLFEIALPVLVVALLAGGIMWLISAGDQKKIEKGKAIITSSLVGILIAFSGWLIVNTIIQTLANPGTSFGKTLLDWTTLKTCPNAIVTAPPAPTTPGGVTTTKPVDTLSNQAKANALVQNQVGFNGGGDCFDANGSRVSANTNLGELQRGEGLSVCRSGCKNNPLIACTKSNITLNPKLLMDLTLIKSVPFNIESLTTGSHAPNSDHYTGNAVDLIPKSVTQANFTALRDQLVVINPAGSYIACEDNASNVVPNCGAGTTHVHATIK